MVSADHLKGNLLLTPGGLVAPIVGGTDVAGDHPERTGELGTHGPDFIFLAVSLFLLDSNLLERVLEG